MKYLGIYGILYNCPFGKRKISCPLYTIEHLTFGEKFKWFENLSSEDKDLIVGKHLECVTERELSY